MRIKAKDIAYGTSYGKYNFLDGPINIRGGEYLTNGIWLIKEKYAPKELLKLKNKVKVKNQPKKSMLKEVFKHESKSQECILIGKITTDSIDDNYRVVPITLYKYTFYKYITPNSPGGIKRRKVRIDKEVSIQSKYIDYFKSLIKIRIKGFNLKAYDPEEPVYIYHGDELIGVIMPMRPELKPKRIIKRRPPKMPDNLSELDPYDVPNDDIPF